MLIKQEKNSIVSLLRKLPAEIADQKRKAIEADLMMVGKYQHYRQSVRRDKWVMGDTHIACAQVLMKHLGLSMAFFTGTDKERQTEVEGVLKQYYQDVMA